ncbi:glycosyltransferase family 2 protein [Mucilaginibacter sp.]|uniref:glycosyltransferase family 2 protein n=1 Tax=Mucilaginibacter sp. TaxID=1882438 RepID=UPI00283B2983|nr:glycosyltransferase family 2 protein [Mucilaginibacter sp.]MDR3694923.1 glycosyltransferase family 2 protein [Mucilaginibacter sp.]
MLKITIVIPVYNRKNITIAGLNNLGDALNYYRQNGFKSLDVNIVVANDGSTDGTGEWIRANRPDVYIVEGTGNLWWSGSVNAGMRYAIDELGASHILLWNDDIICAKDYFFELEKVVTANPQYLQSILVSKVFWLNGNGRLFNFGAYYNKANGKKVLIGLNEQDTFNQVIRVDWSGGMGTVIPVEIIGRIGYLDEVNLPQYHGDIDFFLRAKEQGYATYAIPWLKVYNNAATTGVVKAKKIKDFKILFKSNRSLYNFKQNCYFNERHSNTLVSWLLLFKSYVAVVVKSLL